MAVVRQRTEVFNRPIGVARASAGAEQVGDSIARFASNVSDMAYKQAAKQAQAAGKEAGLAIKSESISAIDPITNKPEAYKPPSNFGTIAAEAYQDIIDRRFEDSVAIELQAKGSEFAESSSSAAQYRDRMSKYVEAMYDAAGPDTSYKRYIEEAGKQYVTKTFTSLQEKERKAAAAKIKKESRLAYALKKIELNKRVKAGETSKELQQEIFDLNQFALTNFVAGNATITEVQAAQDLTYGFEALVGNANLTETYVASSDVQQGKIRAALLNPANIDAYIENEELKKFILDSLGGKATGKQIVDSLSLDEETETQIAKARDTEFLEKNPVTKDMSLSQLLALYDNQTVELKSEAVERLFLLKAEDTLTDKNIDGIINELSKPKSEIDSEGLPESVRDFVGSMNQGDITDLVTNLKGRRSALSGKALQAKNQTLENTELAVESMSEAQDLESLLESFNKAKEASQTITDAGLRNTKNEAIDAKFAELAKSLVNIDGISLEELEQINNAIFQNAESFSTKNVAASNYFDVMSQAYKIADASISRKMSAIVTAKRDNIQNEVNQTILREALFKQENGKPNSKSEQEVLTLHYYKGSAPSASQLNGSSAFKKRAANNSILPIEIDAISEGLTSGNFGEQQAAFQLFNQLTKVQQDVGGEMINRDFLRGKIDDELYSVARAATSVANFRSLLGIADESPQQIYAKMVEYNGSIDSAIKKELGVPNNQNINAIFRNSDYKLNEFDRASQLEFLDILRYNVASGTPINEDNLTKIRKEYIATLTEDNRIIGKRVGDKTHYSMDIVLNDEQQTRLYLDIIKQFEDSPEYEEYLKLTGFTKIASGMLPDGGFLGVDKLPAVITQLNKYIKFDPILDTWVGETGNRSWIVKMPATTGGYMVPMPEGTPIIVTESDYVEDESDEAGLFAYTNRLIAAKASGNKAAIAEAELRYLLKSNPERYPDTDSLLDIPEKFLINEVLLPETINSIYNEEMRDGQ